jgi:hypothetical protein
MHVRLHTDLVEYPMPSINLSRPYYRVYRPKLGTIRDEYVNSYSLKPEFSLEREDSFRAYTYLIADLMECFRFVDPKEKINLKTCSLKFHELIVRSCIEVEANLRGVLSSNSYVPRKNKSGHDLPLNMIDYRKLEKYLLLSRYRVQFVLAKGEYWNPLMTIQPFKKWSSSNPSWYDNYHKIKHDRVLNFKDCTLKNTIESLSGLAAVLSAQYGLRNLPDTPFFRIPKIEWKDKDCYLSDMEPFQLAKL